MKMSSYFGVTNQSVGTLFSSLPGGKSNISNISNTTSSILGEYGSIKSGSYKKLLTAYYKKYGTEGSRQNFKLNNSSTAMSSDSTKKLSSMKSDAQDMQKAADALLAKGDKSLFKESIVEKDGQKTKQVDMDKLYKGVQNFVDSYNSLIEEAGSSKTSGIARSVDNMMKSTADNSDALSKIGITVKADNSLSIDEEKFKKSDVTAVKNLFNTTGAYAYHTKAYSAAIDYNAGIESNKANTYQSNGSYSYNFSSGSMYDSLF